MALMIAPPTRMGGPRAPERNLWGTTNPFQTSIAPRGAALAVPPKGREPDFPDEPERPGFGDLPTGQRGEPLIPRYVGDQLDPGWANPYQDLPAFQGRQYQVPTGMDPATWAAMIRSGQLGIGAGTQRMPTGNMPNQFTYGRHGAFNLPYEQAQQMSKLFTMGRSGLLRGMRKGQVGPSTRNEGMLPPELVAARMRGGY